MTGTDSHILEFGQRTYNEQYMFGDTVYLNQGSYGPCPIFVYEEFLAIRKMQEQNPDHWFRTLKAELYLKTTHVLAEHMDCDFEQVALVENVTCGMNAILKTKLPYFEKPGGTIFCTSLGYGSVIYTIVEAARQHRMKVHVLEIKLPLTSKDSLIRLFEEALEKVEDIRLAVIDYITSATAIMLPIEELTDVFHARSIPVLIDGAHAPNQVPNLSLRSLKCDFFVGALHKWTFTARGSSFIFVRDTRVGDTIQPSITSWGFKRSYSEQQMSMFHRQFFHQGTKDEAGMYTLAKALEFVKFKCGGFESIYEYNTELSRKAKEFLDDRWDNEPDQLYPRALEAPFLKLVKLPTLASYKKNDPDALRLLEDLIRDHNMVTAIVFVNDELYIRLSTQIYNELSDYMKFAEIIDSLR